MIRRLLPILVAVLVVAAGCGDDDTATTVPDAASTAGSAGTVRLLTHASFLVSDEVVEAFTATTGYDLAIIQGDDAGSVLNQAILTAGNPVADVLFGVDNTFLSRALDEDLFVSYRSPALDGVPEALLLDPEHRATPIDFGDVCLNYDKAAFGDGLPVPASLDDLTDPAYRGMLVVQNPATSSPGLAFMLATIAAFGEDGPANWLDFWERLRANDVRVVSGWEEAYYGSFSAASDGDRPLVVSYASSPPAEVIFAEEPLTEAPTGVILDGCFRQIEFAGILTGTLNRDLAEKFIDFMLDTTFQDDIPLNMFVFPVNRNATVPQEFLEYIQVPDYPASLPINFIADNRDEWIGAWREMILD